MLAPKITTHVNDATNRLMTQYRDRNLLVGMVSALAGQVQTLEDTIFDLDAGRQLWNGTNTPASGEQLDQLGTLIGIGRNGLTDSEYILFLFGKIAENFSNDTIAAVETVGQYVFQSADIVVTDLYPAGVAFEAIGTPIPQDLWSLALSLVANSIGAGVQLVFGGASPNSNVFRFKGPNTGPSNGFSSVSAPSTGGVFIDLISG